MPDAARTALIRDTWLRNSREAQRVFLNAEFYRCAVLHLLPVINFFEMDESIASSSVHYLEFRKEWHRRTVDDYEWRVTCEGVEVAQWLLNNPMNLADPRRAARQRSLDTIPGQFAYDLRDPAPVSELWLERDAYRYLLPQRPHYECCVNDTCIQGYPGSFSIHVGILYLWPTPDARYRVGFVQGQVPQRVHTFRGVPLHYDGGFNGTEAEEKSITLLKEWLTPKQLCDFEKKDSFTVIGSTTAKRYRIERSRTFGVHELSETGATVRRLCFVPTMAYAFGDIMLAQKIMLEQDEDEVLKIANFSPQAPLSGERALYEQLAETTRQAILPRLYSRFFGGPTT